jgi:nitrite reductase/ring-hydroxylating ferredoxin subunit
MSITENEKLWVAAAEEIREGHYLTVSVAFAGENISVIVFKFKGKCFAYRNLCVHMPRQLDCVEDMIFDESGQYLRCSMHGIVYDPTTGESVSEICHGKRLTPIELMEDERGIWIVDRRVQRSQAPDDV